MTYIFTLMDVLSGLVWLLAIVDIITIVALIFLDRMDPRSFIAWLIIILILPFIGVVLYLFVGCTVYKRHVFTLKGYEDDKMAEQYKEEIDIIDSDTSADDIDPNLRRFAKTIRNAGGWGYSSNNSVKLITDGEDKMKLLFSDLEKAERFIFFQYYILRDDDVGNRLMEILTEKVRSGIPVYLFTDAFGNGKGPRNGIKEFKRAGGHFELFHIPIKLALSPKKNHRNHRKIAIIDGKIAYCGGYNIGKEYVHKGRFGYWRDASVRMEGGAVIPLSIRVMSDWNYASKKDKIMDPSIFITSDPYEHEGDVRVQTVSGGPDTFDNNPIRTQYILMAREAKKILYITTPYLSPDDTLTESIKCAAMSGTDVRIIVPAVGDHIFVHWNTLTAANELMKYGVRVFLHQNGFDHAKTLLCDDAILSVGSANMDDRSLRLNFETNVIIYSKEICEEMYNVFIHDLKFCTEYSCDEYDNMPRKYKLKTKISYWFRLIS